jgi:chromosome segregation ATPase
MFRKLFILAGIVLIGGWLWARSDAGSYAKTAWKEITSCAKGQVPLSFEIKRAKDMLAQLDRTDDKLISAMAGEMVAIKHLERDVEQLQANLEREKEVIQSAAERIKSSTTLTSEKGGRDVQATDLERRFRLYRQKEATLKNQKDLLAEHQERLNAVKEQRDGLRSQKAELMARIQKLETEVEILKAAETRSKKWLGDSEIREVAKLKELVDSLERRIETGMTELQLRQDQKASPAKAVPMRISTTNLVQEIEVHFGTAKAEVAEK